MNDEAVYRTAPATPGLLNKGVFVIIVMTFFVVAQLLMVVHLGRSVCGDMGGVSTGDEVMLTSPPELPHCVGGGER